MDKGLIALTHVCRQWRDVLAARSSLWTRIHLTSIDITRTLVQRSGSLPLDLYIKGDENIDDSLALIISHIGRVRSLTINGKALPTVLKHFHCNTPLLEELDIEITVDDVTHLDHALFNGGLSSLRELRLCGVETRLPQTNLPNLRVAKLELGGSYKTTEILDFFESTPLLHTAFISVLGPCLSDAPSGRIVHLPHLKDFTFHTSQQDLALLPHLGIPKGVSFTIPGFSFEEEASRLLRDIPQSLPGFENLPDITTMHLSFDSIEKSMRLSGPSGSLYASTAWEIRVPPQSDHNLAKDVQNRKILNSFGNPVFSKIQRLAISNYDDEVETRIGGDYRFFQRLSSANNLRTLVLINCEDCCSFIRMLDPRRNRSNFVLCPNMKELIFEVESWKWTYTKDLVETLRSRASGLRGTASRISSITWVSRDGKLSEYGQLETLFKAMRHVDVECRVSNAPPDWCQIPSVSFWKRTCWGIGYR